MARFDIYPGARGKGYLLDCQADILSILSTRVVVPLLPALALPITLRLNPVFNIDGDDHIMMTQQIFAIPKERLGGAITDLAEEHHAIINALDLLITGI
jgi:toxin CcdB